jgi:putative sugar O-methyltransferase
MGKKNKMSTYKKFIIKHLYFIVEIYLYLKLNFYYLKSRLLYKKIRPSYYSKRDFYVTKMQVQKLFNNLSTNDKSIPEGFIHPVWKNSVDQFKYYLLNEIDEYFLRDRKILHCFGGGAGNLSYFHIACIDYVLDANNSISFFAKNIFSESKVGFPLLCKYRGLILKRVSAEHLYYLSKIMNYSKENNISIRSILEVGGGFGGLAYCFYLLDPRITYVIIDFPEMLAIQYLFLKLNFPNIEIKTGPTIVEGAINLVPISSMSELNVEFSLFVSNFALTETTDQFRLFIRTKKFYNPKLIYITGGKDSVFNSHEHMRDCLVEDFDGTFEDLPQEDCYGFIGQPKN